MKCRVCGKEVVFYQNIERMRAEGGDLCRSNKFTIKTKRVYMYVCMYVVWACSNSIFTG